MDKFAALLEKQMEMAFEKAGYGKELAKITISNRPDLCEYQCNGAMAGAKAYHKAPFMIAGDVVAKLNEMTAADPEASAFESVEMVKPGFINIKVKPSFLADYLKEEASSANLGVEPIGKGKVAVVDYGGANVAKPLHIGHLRAAIIGEALKRMYRYMGYEAIGDVHLGDWGLQMGLIIEETKLRQPDLPYFDESFTGEYPAEAPFTISDLEEIYPCASAKSKVDEDFAKKAHDATVKLQQGHPGYNALFQHILRISKIDLKKNYGNLNVEFDVWKGESDAQPYIPEMMQILKNTGLLYESQGALVVDVAEETDAKEIPPCLVQKSDGASLYATTDLATLLQREKDYDPDEILYVVDKRQDMHFVQVFRTAKKSGIVPEKTKLFFLGFGTMNGKDGKPFKTRSGGVMRLEYLISDIRDAVYERIMANEGSTEEEARENAGIIGLAALKYGDLSNQATKDYVFDIDRFTSFEGNTGPYLLYTIVRIKSILSKYAERNGMDMKDFDGVIRPAESTAEKDLQLLLAKANEAIPEALAEYAPHKLCQYIYEVSNAFNKFYHETRILAEEDAEKQKGYIALLQLTAKVLLDNIHMLGFEAPERM